MMQKNDWIALRAFSAIYFGAVGAPDVPDDITLWGLRLRSAKASTHTSIFAARILQGLSSPCATASAAISTGSSCGKLEGEYAAKATCHRGFPEEVGTETAIFTRLGVTRIMRFAFKLATRAATESC